MDRNFNKWIYSGILMLLAIISAVTLFYTIRFFSIQINKAFSVDETKTSMSGGIRFDGIRKISEKLNIEIEN